MSVEHKQYAEHVDALLALIPDVYARTQTGCYLYTVYYKHVFPEVFSKRLQDVYGIRADFVKHLWDIKQPTQYRLTYKVSVEIACVHGLVGDSVLQELQGLGGVSATVESEVYRNAAVRLLLNSTDKTPIPEARLFRYYHGYYWVCVDGSQKSYTVARDLSALDFLLQKFGLKIPDDVHDAVYNTKFTALQKSIGIFDIPTGVPELRVVVRLHRNLETCGMDHAAFSVSVGVRASVYEACVGSDPVRTRTNKRERLRRARKIFADVTPTSFACEGFRQEDHADIPEELFSTLRIQEYEYHVCAIGNSYILKDPDSRRVLRPAWCSIYNDGPVLTLTVPCTKNAEVVTVVPVETTLRDIFGIPFEYYVKMIRTKYSGGAVGIGEVVIKTAIPTISGI